MTQVAEREPATALTLIGEDAATFDPTKHLMEIGTGKNVKKYLGVQHRLSWVNADVERARRAGLPVELKIESKCTKDLPDLECEAEFFEWDDQAHRSVKKIRKAKGYCEYTAYVRLRIGDMIKEATADKCEDRATFKDYKEKAQTGAIGRALGMLGYGTQYATDLDEGSRHVDAGVNQNAANNNGGNKNNGGTPKDENAEGSITEQQKGTVSKLCSFLTIDPPEGLDTWTFAQTRKWIQEKSQEYSDKRKALATPAKSTNGKNTQ